MRRYGGVWTIQLRGMKRRILSWHSPYVGSRFLDFHGYCVGTDARFPSLLERDGWWYSSTRELYEYHYEGCDTYFSSVTFLSLSFDFVTRYISTQEDQLRSTPATPSLILSSTLDI